MKRTGSTPPIRDYLERWGFMFESLGSTRMMGKVLAWLLVCDPPEQTAKQISEAVGASAGSVSGATRTLVSAGMIEKVGLPGERSAYFRVSEGMWGGALTRKMARGAELGALAREGLELLRPGNREGALRLREIESYCRYVERNLPAFLEGWFNEWREERKQWMEEGAEQDSDSDERE